jgi:hypothetical protein
MRREPDHQRDTMASKTAMNPLETGAMLSHRCPIAAKTSISPL